MRARRIVSERLPLVVAVGACGAVVGFVVARAVTFNCLRQLVR